MKIAIVDDVHKEIEKLEELLHEYSDENYLTLQTMTFGSGEDFLSGLSKNTFDAVFLDIYMEGIDGIETASKLAKLAPHTLVIYLTASREKVFDAAPLHPFDYILKDHMDKDRIYGVMSELENELKSYAKHLTFISGDDQIRLPLRKLSSITSAKNYTEFHLDEEIKRFRIPFSQVEKDILGYDRFLTCNRGVIVNMDHILRENKDTFLLTNKEIIPIRKRDIKAIKQKYHDYLFRSLDE